MTPANTWFCSWKSRNSGMRMTRRPNAAASRASRIWTATTRLASRYGNGSSSTFWMTLKMVVAAPMPSASVRIASAVKAGWPRSARSPYRRSCHMRSPDPDPRAGRAIQPVSGLDGERLVESVQIGSGGIGAQRRRQVGTRLQRRAHVLIAFLRPRDLRPAHEEPLLAGESLDDRRRPALERQLVGAECDRQAAEIAQALGGGERA